MKNFEYNETRAQREEVITYASSITFSETTLNGLEELSSLLNKYYPNSALQGSHVHAQWLTARKHVDNLLSRHGVSEGNSWKEWLLKPTLQNVVSWCVIGVLGIAIAVYWPKVSEYFSSGSETTQKSEAQVESK